ncbi:MAG TPA: DUF3014 domain-containing protein [Steroidobacteraceae bacterium]|nr:DUF3014 domain-containing protein [Steroidobacteraceae bacterium]
MPNKAIPALIAVLILGSAATWYWWPRLAPTPTPPPLVSAPPAPETPPAIAHPLPPVTDPGPALPPLNNSDPVFLGAIEQLPGGDALRTLLQPETLIRHLVATVDNLPRARLALEMRPVHSTPGQLLTVGDEQQATLDDHNAARYATAIAALRALDMRAVSKLYQHFYPLFQRAYEDLGYPHAYFNDRLVATIDDLLATPQPTAPLALVRPKVFWEFADPELEARSAGQKLLLRMGNENATIVRAKLRELRALVVTAPGTAPAGKGT